jgi:peptide/nickel transport system substrate-binding protein
MITYARDAMIEEVWRIVLDDIVYIPLHHQLIVWAMRDNLDLPVHPVGIPAFRDAWFKSTVPVGSADPAERRQDVR